MSKRASQQLSSQQSGAMRRERGGRITGRGAASPTVGKRWVGIANRYLLAVIAVPLATALYWGLARIFGPLPAFVTLYPAVLLVASVGGGGPGIAATILAALAADYFILPPLGFGIETAGDRLALAIFTGANVCLSVLAERLRRARWAEAVSAAQEQELTLLDLGNLLALDPDHRIIRWSQGCRRLYGFDAQEAEGRVTHELLQTRFPQPLEQIRRVVLEQGRWEGEVIRRRRDGAEVVVAVLWELRRDETGQPLAILEVNNDITDRKRAEEAQKEALIARQAEDAQRLISAYNRSLIEASLDPLVTIDANGKIMDVNAATEKATGYSRLELIGTDFSDYFTEPEKARAGYQQVFREGAVQDYALQIRHRDGPHTPVLYNASVYRDAGGKVIGVFAAARDITERERAEEAVKVERQRFNDLLELLPAYLVLLTPDYHVAFANRFFRERFGESHGQRCFEYLFGRRVPCEVCETYTVLKTKAPHEWEWTGPDDRNYHVFDFPFTDTDGSPLIMEMGIDITERKQMEIALRRLNEELEQRVAARTADLTASNKELEAFAYSVSHDLRAPLRAMDGFSQAVLEDHADKLDPEGRSHLQRVRAASQRMAQLIDGMLTLSRITRSEMRRAALDMSGLAQTISVELRKAAPARQVEFAIAPGLLVHADADLLRAALENLLGNAWKFTSKHAQARIEVGAVQRDGEAVYFVRDDGAGFDMAYANKLFGAFQRLHAASEFEGTGIGLATVQRIVHRHGGQIWAEGQLEKGATFFFTLPPEARHA